MDNTSSFPPQPNEAPAPTNKGFLYVAGEAALTSLGLGLYGAMCGGATYAVAGAFTAGMGVGRPAAVMAAFQMGARKIGAGAGTAGAIFPPAFLLAGQNPEQSMIPILVSGSFGALVSAQFPPKGYRKLPSNVISVFLMGTIPLIFSRAIWRRVHEIQEQKTSGAL